MTARAGVMTLRQWTVWLAAVVATAAIGSTRPAVAQTSWSVSTAAELTDALELALGNNFANPSLVNTISLAGYISGSSQRVVNANVNIVGRGSVYPYSTTLTGSLSQITLYSDSGSAFFGYGGIEMNRLVPVAVPEPAAIACAPLILRRQRA